MIFNKVFMSKLSLNFLLSLLFVLTLCLQMGCDKKEKQAAPKLQKVSVTSVISNEEIDKEADEEIKKQLASLPEKERKELEKMLENTDMPDEESEESDTSEMPKWFELSQESKDAIEIAVNALRMDLSDEEKLAAISELDGIDNPAVFDAVLMALDEGNVDVREAALDAVMEINDVAVIPVINKALEDEDPEIRGYALDALMDVDDEKVNEPILTALDDENVEVRENATDILLYIESPNILPSLAKALEDDNEDIRDLALITLEDIEDTRTLSILIEKGLLHENEAIREDVLDSIEFITDQEFENYEEAQKWYDVHGNSFEFE